MIKPAPGVPVKLPTPGQPAPGVPVKLPGGPTAGSLTYWPMRGLKFPHATSYCDSAYYAGYPENGKVTQPALKGYWHTGTDMNGPGACSSDLGDPLYAVRAGVIEWVGVGSGSWGRIVVERVVVDGKTWWVRYAHVQTTGKDKSTVVVKAGQSVNARAVLAFCGKGNWPCAHLHLDVFHTKPPRWDWWPTRYGPAAEVSKYCTDPDAWLRRLGAIAP